MAKPTIRYFVVNDAEAKELVGKLVAGRDAHNAMLDGLQKKLKVHGLQIDGEHRPIGVLFHKNHVPPRGCQRHSQHTINGQPYIEYRPILTRKLGQEIHRLFMTVGGFNPSKYLVKHYKVDNSVISADGSRLIFTSAGVYDGRIVFMIPEDAKHKVSIPPQFEEIDKAAFEEYTDQPIYG